MDDGDSGNASTFSKVDSFSVQSIDEMLARMREVLAKFPPPVDPFALPKLAPLRLFDPDAAADRLAMRVFAFGCVAQPPISFLLRDYGEPEWTWGVPLRTRSGFPQRFSAVKAGAQRGYWVELWPNRGRAREYPPNDADVLTDICALKDKELRELRPWLETVHSGGSGIMRRWIGFVPAAALDEFREVLKKHGITLEVEES